MISGQNVSIIPSAAEQDEHRDHRHLRRQHHRREHDHEQDPRPRNLKRAKPKPTRLHEMTCPTTHSVVMTTVFASAGQKFILSGASDRG